MGLANYFKELDVFVLQMKEKIILHEPQHKHDMLDYYQIKVHLIDEILELFNLRGSVKGEKIRKELESSFIDSREAIDVAALCFAIELVDKRK